LQRASLNKAAIEEDAVREERSGPFPTLRIGDFSDARHHVLLLLCRDGPFPI